QKFVRAGGRFLASVSPARPWKIRADVSAAFAEGEDPFRDYRSARARGAVELDLIPASFLVAGGYGVEADDFFRIGRTELSHRAFAEAVWIPSVAPLAVVQVGIFGETLRATIEGDRRSSPGATLAADLETPEGFALSFSGEYRYDLFESGVRAHAVLLTVRLRAKISENLFFLVEYGLDSNGSSSGSEAFFAQRAAVGFRVAS
ncbi:MAG: hypothetical protein MUC63_06510, partial [Planctomycetes bacterium]|nr:hypothetical protein [Planctomycetota bacterium]